MSKITRQTQKIFGSSAGLNQISQFGSLTNAAPIFTTNIATIQALTNYLVGWYDAIQAQNAFAIEDMNAVCYLYAYQLAYLFQAGIPEWDSGTTYYTGSLAQESGQIFRSLIDTNLNNDPSTSSDWAAPISPGLFTPTSMSVVTTVTSGYTLQWAILNVSSGKTFTVNSGGYAVGELLLDDGTVLCDGTLIY